MNALIDHPDAASHRVTHSGRVTYSRRVALRSRLGIALSILLEGLALILLPSAPTQALDAPGGPGLPSVWAPAAKDFLGTSTSPGSRVYFTGAQGIVTEVFYPTLDTAQNVDLQFLVTDAASTWGDEERRQSQHQVSLVNKRALLWTVATTADNGRWRITKRILTDPGHQSLIQRVTFDVLEPGKTLGDFNVYLLNNPAINNSGGGGPNQAGPDNSRTLSAGGRTMLVASEPNSTSSALAVSIPWKSKGGQTMASNGFVGVNDGYTDLFSGSSDKRMDWAFDGAFAGNVAQMGWIELGSPAARSVSFDVVLSFGASESDAMNEANATLGSNLNSIEQAYTSGWVAYCHGLNNQGGAADDQYYLAAMTLKTSQDKSNGAMVAGMGTPWGEASGDANRGGYHLVWARDLFKFASALLAAGDTATANRAVEYLFNVQMQTTSSPINRAEPGRFPQNSFVDGTPYWNGTQMDEAAMPIILAWKLKRTDLWPKIKLAAEFLARTGPVTEQERWEEMSGFSPSTIAAEIAGLVCAASLAQSVNDPGAADFYLRKADAWRNNIANWTFTTTGFFPNDRYYIRIDANQDPNDDVMLTYGNGSGSHGERYIVDGGFLELVRMGAFSANDWTILETIPEYDAILKQSIPGKGDAWFRYNYDGYGEHNDGSAYNGSGRGRLWPIFTAERGIYEIAKSGNGSAGNAYLSALKAFSSDVGFIPEQVWNTSANITGWDTLTPTNDQPGTATGSMRPLNWAMGEYINLVAAIARNAGDAPAVVCQRYSCSKPQVKVTFDVRAETQWGESIYLVGSDPLLSNWQPTSAIQLSSTNYPQWSVSVSLPASTTFEYKFVKINGAGAIAWEGGDNRHFTTPISGEVTRDDVFR